MATYYADTSALVKRHINEVGSAWTQALLDPLAHNTVITARISIVEVFSALNRRVRHATLSVADYDLVANDFVAIYETEYQLVDLVIPIVARARQLLERHPPRAYDSIQLASALVANEPLLADNLPTLTFLAADINLRS